MMKAFMDLWRKRFGRTERHARRVPKAKAIPEERIRFPDYIDEEEVGHIKVPRGDSCDVEEDAPVDGFERLRERMRPGRIIPEPTPARLSTPQGRRDAKGAFGSGPTGKKTARRQGR